MKQAVQERSKVSTVKGTTFKAVAFTEPTGEDTDGVFQSETIHAGTYDNADEAWAAAKAKCLETAGMGYSIRTIEPLLPLTKISKGETINDARRLIRAIAGWGEQHLSGDDKKTLCAATIALDKTLMRGWTEVDEALSRFSSAVCTLQRKSDTESIAHAIDCLHIGSGFLQRWQDRNGRIGNVE